MRNNKFLLEFGQRKDRDPAPEQHVAVTIETLQLAKCLASGLVRVFSAHRDLGAAANEPYWHLNGSTPRATWQSHDYYVALTKIDGKTKFPPAREEF